MLPWAACLLLAICAGCGAGPGKFNLRRVAVDEFGGGDGAISPDGNSLLLSSHRSGSWDLWRFDLPGNRWEQLTNDPADELEGQWSPDGTKIVYTATKFGNKDLFLLDLKNHSTRRLTDDPEDDEYPNWSPDGNSIVYTGGAWNHRDFFLISPSGGSRRKITRVSGKAGACSFHPDGRHLICHRFDSGTGNLWLISIADGFETPVTAGKFWDYKPAISPDGRWLAFSRSTEGPSSVRIMPAGGGDPRPLAISDADDRWPSWSRQIPRMMFHRLVDRGSALRILDRSSGAIQVVAEGAESPGQGSFDPAGRRVVYSAMHSGKRVLSIRDLDSGSVRVIDPGPGECDFPRWSPDGSQIAFSFNTGEHWELATVAPDGRGFKIWTASLRNVRSINGVLDWSPDSRSIVFHASTDPFQADIYLLDLTSGKIRNLTADSWFSEAPAFTPDGSAVAFMSTRGGGWTWGFFQLTLASGTVAPLSSADYTEKNFIRIAHTGHAVWSSYGDDGVEYLMERPPGGKPERIGAAGRWARWPSYSSDGSRILFTAIDHKVEYWVADNVAAPDSPLMQAPPPPSVSTAPSCPPDPAEARMSPVKMHHR